MRIPAFLMLAAGLQAQVVVVPRVAAVASGRTLTFQARPAGGDLRWSAHAEDGQAAGSIDPATGAYRPPEVAAPRVVRIAASGPAGAGEAVVTVLPAAPLALLDRVLGPGWLEPFAADLPFLDLETGQRFPGPERVERWDPMGVPRWLRTGCGQPCRLAWTPPAGARAQLLSYREGDALVRRDVTGLDADTLTPWDRIGEARVEALSGPCGHGARRSWVQVFYVYVRGLLPFAGSRLAQGHQDGAASAARFREPAGMACLPVAADDWRLAVADPADHTVRMVLPNGRVATLCGEPGRPGHRDHLGPSLWGRWWGGLQAPPPARLRQPTHLATAGPGAGLFKHHDLILADSGNHVLRGLCHTGQTDTLAGSPGHSGHRDADQPLEALFHDPRGLAVGPGGRVYVADRGNRVIRAVAASGQVTTLAGSPGQAGTRDGQGPEARFTDLEALAFAESFPGGRRLLILDGHALRALDPATGAVTTLVGDVAVPGSREVAGATLEERLALRTAPCLRDPADLLWLNGTLLIADRGNHSVRRFIPASMSLLTLAGHPDQGEVRYGLLRDGLGGPLPPAYAALDAPRGLARRPGPPGDRVAVTTGPGLALLFDGADPADHRMVRLEAAGPVARNQAFVVRVRVEPVVEGLLVHGETGRLTLECREADGALGHVAEVEAAPGAWTGIPARLAQPGQGRVVVRYLSPAGVSACQRLAMEVE